MNKKCKQCGICKICFGCECPCNCRQKGCHKCGRKCKRCMCICAFLVRTRSGVGTKRRRKMHPNHSSYHKKETLKKNVRFQKKFRKNSNHSITPTTRQLSADDATPTTMARDICLQNKTPSKKESQELSKRWLGKYQYTHIILLPTMTSRITNHDAECFGTTGGPKQMKRRTDTQKCSDIQEFIILIIFFSTLFSSRHSLTDSFTSIFNYDKKFTDSHHYRRTTFTGQFAFCV